jgi:hypothetical protein
MLMMLFYYGIRMWSKRQRLVLAAWVALVILLLGAAGGADATTDLTFVRGHSGKIGQWETLGFAARDYVTIYHTSGVGWNACYVDTGEVVYGCLYTTGNPTTQPADASYARGFCSEGETGQLTWWNCHTTQP